MHLFSLGESRRPTMESLYQTSEHLEEELSGYDKSSKKFLLNIHIVQDTRYNLIL